MHSEPMRAVVIENIFVTYRKDTLLFAAGCLLYGLVPGVCSEIFHYKAPVVSDQRKSVMDGALIVLISCKEGFRVEKTGRSTPGRHRKILS